MGWIRSDRLRCRQRLPRRPGLAPARAGHRWNQRQFRSLVGGYGRRRVSCATGSARGPDVVTCRCTGGSGRCHLGFVGSGRGSPDRLGPLPAPLPAGGQAGIPGRVGARGPRLGADRNADREDPAGRATRKRSSAAAQEASDGLPSRRGSRGDARRCRGDPRGRGVLRPRHGFADGRRTSAPTRTRNGQGDSGHSGDGSPAPVRRGRLPARRGAGARRRGIRRRSLRRW